MTKCKMEERSTGLYWLAGVCLAFKCRLERTQYRYRSWKWPFRLISMWKWDIVLQIALIFKLVPLYTYHAHFGKKDIVYLNLLPFCLKIQLRVNMHRCLVIQGGYKELLSPIVWEECGIFDGVINVLTLHFNAELRLFTRWSCESRSLHVIWPFAKKIGGIV